MLGGHLVKFIASDRYGDVGGLTVVYACCNLRITACSVLPATGPMVRRYIYFAVGFEARQHSAVCFSIGIRGR